MSAVKPGDRVLVPGVVDEVWAETVLVDVVGLITESVEMPIAFVLPIPDLAEAPKDQVSAPGVAASDDVVPFETYEAICTLFRRYGAQFEDGDDSPVAYVDEVIRLLARPEATRSEAEINLGPSDPHLYPGFEGCTSRDPDHCACATDSDPICTNCEQEIEAGEMVQSVTWPEFPSVPLDSPEQDWTFHVWHVDCSRADQITNEGDE